MIALGCNKGDIFHYEQKKKGKDTIAFLAVCKCDAQSIK